jgi:hypothetical protein
VASGLLRYSSDDPSIVSVTADGVAYAKAIEGATVIRVVAHDGIERLVPVSVINYAQPATFTMNRIDDVIQDYWKAQGQNICDLVTMVLKEDVGRWDTIRLSLDNQANLVSSIPVPDDVAALAQAILTGYWKPAIILIYPGGVQFRVYNKPIAEATHEEFVFGYDILHYGKESNGEPAPHWGGVAWQVRH